MLGSGVSVASPTATVTTRPRRSMSRLTPRPTSRAASAMARATSLVRAASGGTRRRYRLLRRLSWLFFRPCVLPCTFSIGYRPSRTTVKLAMAGWSCDSSVRHERDSLATMRRALPAALVMLLTVATGWAQPDQSGAASQSSMTGAGPGSAAVPAAGIAGSVVSGITCVRAGALATALGDVVPAAGGVLTWRGAEVVATFFLGAADALVRRSQDGGADDSALSAPPLLTTAGDQNDPSDWLLPLDAVQLLGVTATPLAGQVFLGLPTG